MGPPGSPLNANKELHKITLHSQKLSVLLISTRTHMYNCCTAAAAVKTLLGFTVDLYWMPFWSWETLFNLGVCISLAKTQQLYWELGVYQLNIFNADLYKGEITAFSGAVRCTAAWCTGLYFFCILNILMTFRLICALSYNSLQKWHASTYFSFKASLSANYWISTS